MNASTKLAWGLALPLFVAGCNGNDTDTETGLDTDTGADTDTDTGADTDTDSGEDTDTETEPVCGDDTVEPNMLCFTTSDVSASDAVNEVAVGDFDGGHPDVIYTTANNEIIGLKSGDGAGGLGADSTVISELSPSVGLAVGQLDDGPHLDIVTSRLVFFGDGTGSSPLSQSIHGTEGTLRGLHVADLEGTGPSADVLLLAEYSGLVVTSGQEGENLTEDNIYVGTDAIVGALARHTADRSAAVWLLGDGEGSPTTTLRATPMAYAEGELNRDTDIDATIEAGGVALAVGDLNGDDFDEVIVANSAGRINVLFASGTGGWVDQSGAAFVGYDAGADPNALAVADVDGDGDNDVVVANESTDTITVMLNDGSGNLTAEAIELAAGAAPTRVATGDLNGDGVHDIVVATSAPEELTVLLSNP